MCLNLILYTEMTQGKGLTLCIPMRNVHTKSIKYLVLLKGFLISGGHYSFDHASLRRDGSVIFTSLIPVRVTVLYCVPRCWRAGTKAVFRR